jgi:cytochrome c biogenesis protein CcdA
MRKLFLLFLLLVPVFSFGAGEEFCATYFTGIGCPHCSKSDPVVLEDILEENSDLIIVEYEIDQQQSNAPLLYLYNEKYHFPLGIPTAIFGKDDYLSGDKDINDKIRDRISLGSNLCPLSSGPISFEDLEINSISGFPKIWRNGRILMRKGKEGDNEVLKNLLTKENLGEYIDTIDFVSIDPEKVPLSGDYVEFENAIKVGDWVFQWNGSSQSSSGNEDSGVLPNGEDCIDLTKGEGKITFTKVLSLALIDAVNPCALAVLALMLIAILSYNKQKRKSVLLAGLAFTFSVFIMYLIYGLVIIRSFQLIQALTSVRVWLHQLLGFGAVVLGLIKFRDYFKSGAVCNSSSRVNKIVSRVTSPLGAFSVGAFVTIFLLPCTIGPYVICGGILSSYGILKSLPLLLMYNLIFVLPMAAVVLLIYFGLSRIEDISAWQAKNLKYLDLISAVLITILGVLMIFGIV